MGNRPNEYPGRQNFVKYRVRKSACSDMPNTGSNFSVSFREPAGRSIARSTSVTKSRPKSALTRAYFLMASWYPIQRPRDTRNPAHQDRVLLAISQAFRETSSPGTLVPLPLRRCCRRRSISASHFSFMTADVVSPKLSQSLSTSSARFRAGKAKTCFSSSCRSAFIRRSYD